MPVHSLAVAFACVVAGVELEVEVPEEPDPHPASTTANPTSAATSRFMAQSIRRAERYVGSQWPDSNGFMSQRRRTTGHSPTRTA